jgi:hypothetical protein
MRICTCHIAVTLGPITSDYASRFVATFKEYPPGVDTDFMVICNGGPLNTELAMIFAPLNPIFFPRRNDPGWDISAYQDAARGPCAEYDAVLWLGESNYFHREGWLKQLVEAWQKHGAGMYGPYASNAIRSHLNTTAFFCAPSLVVQYPSRANDRQSRMDFEHGPDAIWRIADRRKMPVRMVTWDGTWEPRFWRMPQNIIWRGDQTNCLMWCNHTDGYNNIPPNQRARWAAHWDKPFR